MVERLAQRLTYANTVATIALFVALGGGSAYAVATIGANDIKKKAVRSKHIKGDQVLAKHIKGNQVLAKHQAGAFALVRAGEGGPPIVDADVAKAKGIGDADVPQVNASGDFSAHFCFRLGFKPRHVQATIASPSNGAVIVAALSPNVPASCPNSHDDASAVAIAVPSGFFFDRDFYIWFLR